MAASGRRRKNKLQLPLNSSPLEKCVADTSLILLQIDEVVNSQNLDVFQKSQIEAFLRGKSKIEGEICLEDLVCLRDIDRAVYMVKHKPTGLIMARKVGRMNMRQQMMQALQVYHEFVSPYIIGFYGAFCIHEKVVSSCIEYMDGGSLDFILKKVNQIPERVLGVITCHVLKGLKYLGEEHYLIHGNLKPSNILVNSKGEIKLCDLGVFCQLSEGCPRDESARCYMSPECLQASHYSANSDLWSLGISLEELALGRYPIPDIDASDDVYTSLEVVGRGTSQMNICELLVFVVNEEPPRLPKNRFSPPFCDFVYKCLKKDPSERADLKQLIAHPWIMRAEAEKDAIDFAGFVSHIIGKEMQANI